MFRIFLCVLYSVLGSSDHQVRLFGSDLRILEDPEDLGSNNGCCFCGEYPYQRRLVTLRGVWSLLHRLDSTGHY